MRLIFSILFCFALLLNGNFPGKSAGVETPEYAHMASISGRSLRATTSLHAGSALYGGEANLPSTVSFDTKNYLLLFACFRLHKNRNEYSTTDAVRHFHLISIPDQNDYYIFGLRKIVV